MLERGFMCDILCERERDTDNNTNRESETLRVCFVSVCVRETDREKKKREFHKECETLRERVLK